MTTINQQPTTGSLHPQSAFGGCYAGKRVLLTGHTGFKGAWLAEWLLSLGAEVTGFSLPPPTQPSLFDQLGLAARLRHIEGDVRDLAAVRAAFAAARPDFVFHLAAQPLVRLSYDQPTETFAANVMGTANVLEALRLYHTQLISDGCSLLGSEETNNPHSATNNRARSANDSSSLLGSETINQHSSTNNLPGRVIAAVMITTDKCYENREWVHSYREEDPMGGYDPYSASKGAAELVISSYRRSFFNPSTSQPLNAAQPLVRLASARAGNVIGGGDWALDRIVPDCMRALAKGDSIPVRNKVATRPWQHVLEPLSGYLWLGAALALSRSGNADAFSSAPADRNGSAVPLHFPAAVYQSAFNFGPALASNKTVAELVQEILKHWPGRWEDKSDPHAPHEAKLLNLATDKAHHLLGWSPAWTFAETIERTVAWYRAASGALAPQLLADGSSLLGSDKTNNQQPITNNLAQSAIHAFTAAQITAYTASARAARLAWACSAASGAVVG